MNEYDEDLSENAWFLALSHKHKQFFTQATNERYMICIPRTGSWKGGADAPKTFHHSCFQSHCIKFECEAVPQKKEAEEAGLKNKYLTSNGKIVLIEGSKISCGSGFVERATSFDSRSEQLDLPSGGLNHFARILFEETHFNCNDQSYKMLCLSRPLELPLVSETPDHSAETTALSPLSGDYRFDFSGLQGYQFWWRANNADKLKHAVDVKIMAYIKTHVTDLPEKSTSSFESKDSVEMCGPNDIQPCLAMKIGKDKGDFKKYRQRAIEDQRHDVMEGERQQLNSVTALFNSCFQIVSKDSKIKKELENPSALEVMKCSVEKYVFHEIYGSVFRQISNIVALQESSFNKMTRNLSDIQPSDLVIDEMFWLSLPKAKRRLCRLNKYCAPKDKLSCVQSTVHCITSQRESVLSSDDLLPIFVYLVIKCNIPNWITNLVFLQQFQLVPLVSEEMSYYLVTLEAALEHIKQSSSTGNFLEKYTRRKNAQDVSPLEEFFQRTEEGDLISVKEILNQSAKARESKEQKMCHPLCSCEKCSQLKLRLSSKACDSGVSVYSKNEKGQTALHVAAMSGHHEVVDLLLEHKAELNVTDYRGSTPLHTAALFGCQSVIFLLLHHGANANAVDNNNNTPLHLSCQRGHEGCVKALLYFDPSSSVVDVGASNDEGDTPLHIASRWGYEIIVAALIEYGANPKSLNRRRQSAVDVSHNTRVSNTIKVAASQVVKLVKTLKHLQPHIEELPEEERGSPVKAERSPRKLNALSSKEMEDKLDNVYVIKQVEKLFRAVADNDINMVKFLCGWQTEEEKSEGDAREEGLCHPLCQCTKCQPLSHEHVLHANSSNKERYSGLIIAAKNGFAEIAKLFLDHNASVNAKTKKLGYSALHFACENGHAEVAELILSHEGANADVRDLNGCTPLYGCTIYNFPWCALVLLKNGASVNIRNRKGDSPLHTAVKWKNVEIIKILIQHGALAYYKNHAGQTPITYSEEDPDVRIVLFEAILARERSDSHLEWNLSPEMEISSTGTDLKAESLFSDSSDEQTKNHQHETLSAQDEALANTLYAKFKDPVPPTPPACGDDLIGSEGFSFPTNQSEENKDSSVKGKSHSWDKPSKSTSSAECLKCTTLDRDKYTQEISSNKEEIHSAEKSRESTSSDEVGKYSLESEKHTHYCRREENHSEENSSDLASASEVQKHSHECKKYTCECDGAKVDEELLTGVDQCIGPVRAHVKEHDRSLENFETVADSGDKYFEIG